VGGGMYVGGTATVNDSTFTQNTAPGASSFGGGLWVGKAVATDAPNATVDHATFTHNSGAAGGAVGVNTASTLTLRNLSLLDQNTATFGAGLYTAGSSTVTDSTVSANAASFLGGGIYGAAPGSLSMTGGIVDANSALSAGGLLLADGATATLEGTAVTGNSANGGTTANAGNGGGVFSAGTLTISDSLLKDNHAVANTLSGSSAGVTGFGGAVFAGSSAAGGAVRTTLTGDTLTGNTARSGSALVTASTAGTNAASIVNSTITGNSTSVSFGAVVPFHPLSVVSSTIADNTSPAGGSGGLYLFAPAATNVSGSIVAGNSGGNCTNVPTDGGYNLTDAGDSSCGFTAAKNDLFGNPQLGALANNGGPTPTRLPGPSSPAINAIPGTTATAVSDAVSGNPITLCVPGSTDQRGVTRPQGEACDIGAVEADLSAPAIIGPASVTFVTGNAGTFSYSTTGVPTANLSAAGTLPTGVTFVDNGDGTATLAGTPAANAGGNYSIVITASNGVDPDATLAVAITVNQPPTVSGPASATFVVNHAGSVGFTSTGFPAVSLTASGPLPAGVTFVDNGNGTATLAGAPAPGTVGSYPITITASNGVPPNATLAFTLIVNPAVSVATTSLPNGQAGVAYNAQLAASGGASPYTWAITSGALPAGLSLAANGTISGTPTGPAGTATFTVKVTDSLVPPGTATKVLSITIDRGPTMLFVNPVLLQVSGPLRLTVGIVSARLVGGVPGVGLGGQTVVFKAGGTTVCTGVTAADGNVRCTMTIFNTLLTILNLGVSASYGGSATWLPSSGSAGLIG
jgi:putative Ig domain-containing protein